MKVSFAILCFGLCLGPALAGILVVCETGYVDLECPEGKVADIKSALWGRQTGAACPPKKNALDGGCDATDVTDVLRAGCGPDGCVFRPHPLPLCDGIGKPVIKLDYSCEEPIYSENQIRLDGWSEAEGIAQIYRNGEWGNICDVSFLASGWPTVLCMELGYPLLEMAVYAVDVHPSYQGSAPVAYQSPACNPSNAVAMAACGADDKPKCDNTKDVVVKCAAEKSRDGRENEVRLALGQDEGEGIAQMFKYGQWGNICDEGYGKTGWPSVLCKELGYASASAAVNVLTKYPSYVSGLPINFHGPGCKPSNADSMAECGQDSAPSCGHGKAVYVTCK